ncbi:DUF5951 family protein [Pseudescherichia vulneris]
MEAYLSGEKIFVKPQLRPFVATVGYVNNLLYFPTI